VTACRRKVIRLVAWAVVLALYFPVITAGAPPVELHGVVRDASGVPIRGVEIGILSRAAEAAVTDSEGAFRLDWDSRTILVEHRDYVPQFLTPVQLKGVPLDIRLQSRAAREWVIPVCRCARLSRTNPFRTIRFRLPRGLKSKVIGGKSKEVAYITDKSKNAEMKVWFRVVSSGVPASNFFKSSGARATTRPIDLDEAKGYDVRVVGSDTRVSRWVGVFYTFMVYENAEPEVAKKFDAVIDGVCHY